MERASHRAGPAPPPVLMLAAGRGTRLGELGRQRPKVLVPVGERPILDLQLEHLAGEGVEHVVMNAHHLADQILDYVERYRGPLKIEVLVENTLLGTAGAAVNARPRLGEETFIVLYGDVMIFEDLGPLLHAHRESGALATLSVYEREDTSQKGVVEIDGSGRVLSFTEKDPERTGPGLVNAGLYALEPAILDGLAPGTALDFGHDVFPAALRRGAHLQVYRLPRPVLDIGTPGDLAAAVAERRSQARGRAA
jgi:mannose-1-phosphate guanylyltransferase